MVRVFDYDNVCSTAEAVESETHGEWTEPELRRAWYSIVSRDDWEPRYGGDSLWIAEEWMANTLSCGRVQLWRNGLQTYLEDDYDYHEIDRDVETACGMAEELADYYEYLLHNDDSYADFEEEEFYSKSLDVLLPVNDEDY